MACLFYSFCLQFRTCTVFNFLLSSILHMWPNSRSFLWMALCSRSFSILSLSHISWSFFTLSIWYVGSFGNSTSQMPAICLWSFCCMSRFHTHIMLCWTLLFPIYAEMQENLKAATIRAAYNAPKTVHGGEGAGCPFPRTSLLLCLSGLGLRPFEPRYWRPSSLFSHIHILAGISEMQHCHALPVASISTQRDLEKFCRLCSSMIFGRPYYQSHLWYTVSSVCRLYVCLQRFVLCRNSTS